MQTFVTTATDDFRAIAKTLDNKRLNKQALEAWQIMMTNLKLDPEGNHREPKGWYNHPATKMWRGHEITLLRYIQAMTNEWVDRGFKTTIADKARTTIEQAIALGRVWSMPTQPEWMLDHDLYSKIASTHRTALLSKDYKYYSQFNWPEDHGFRPETYEYIWASMQEEANHEVRH
jgi:hypothetical protein